MFIKICIIEISLRYLEVLAKETSNFKKLTESGSLEADILVSIKRVMFLKKFLRCFIHDFIWEIILKLLGKMKPFSQKWTQLIFKLS